MIVRVVLFFLASTLQIQVSQAANLIAASELPEGCFARMAWPCSVSTGDRTRRLQGKKRHWELDKNVLMSFVAEDWAQLHQGQLVVSTKKDFTIQTLFGNVNLKQSKVLVKLTEKKLEVLVLDGEEVQVEQKSGVVQKLLPGFTNWYTSEIIPSYSSEVPQVIDIQDYARRRAAFFMDYQTGFQSELRRVAKHVKRAAYLASHMHRDLVERHIASIKQAEEKAREKELQEIQFDKKIRKLFLKKISYQD